MFRTRISALLIIALATVAGCRDKGGPSARSTPVQIPRISGTPPFVPPPPDHGRAYDSVMAFDFEGDGMPEYIVTSLMPDSLKPAGARADMLQVFRYDSIRHTFAPVLGDSIKWILSLQLRDLDGDRRPELIVTSNAGGNDPVATNGMTIYAAVGRSATEFRTLLGSKHGNPAFATMGSPPENVVITCGELWPEGAAHAEAALYTDDILALRDGRYVSVRRKYSQYFANAAQDNVKAYANARRSLPPLPRVPAVEARADSAAASAPSPPVDTVRTVRDSLDAVRFKAGLKLYMPAALAMIAFNKAALPKPLRTFWDSENAYLRAHMTPGQFAELAALYARLIEAREPDITP